MRLMGALSLALLLVGCFKPALEQVDVDVEDTAAEDTVMPDVAAETDTPEMPDSDASPPLDVDAAVDVASPDTDTDVEVVPECGLDTECTSISVVPCVVGRCNAGRCVAVNVSVPCDDGDICTTSDQCQQGTCRGRAFTEAESKSWIVRLGGDGADTVTAVVTHPSGDVSVLGAFEGTMVLPDGASLVSSGGVDGFLVRFTSTGTRVHSVVFGDATSDDAPLHAAGRDEGLAVLWGTRPSDQSTGPSYQAVLTPRTGTNFAGISVPGFPVAFEVTDTGRMVVVSSIEEEVRIRLASGGEVVLSPSTGLDGFIAALDGTSAAWVLPIQGLKLGEPSPDWYQKLLFTEQDARWIATLAPGARVGTTADLVGENESADSIWELALDVELGRVVSSTRVSSELNFVPAASRHLRGASAVTSYASVGPVAAPTAIVISGSNRGPDGAERCSAGFEAALESDIVFGLFAPTSEGRMLMATATSQSAVALGDSVTLAAGPHLLAVGAYGADCRALGVVPMVISPFTDRLPKLAALGVAHGFVMLKGGEKGRAFVAGAVGGVSEPGGPFGASVITTLGSRDGIVGSLGPQALHQCVPAP